MARPTPGRAQFHYLESWLLPSLGLRVNVFHYSAGHEQDHDYYLDIGEYTPGESVWRSEDHYLDLVNHAGRRTELLDLDELLDAQRHSLVTPETAELAIRRALAAIEGLAGNDHDLDRWRDGNGLALTWLAGYPLQT